MMKRPGRFELELLLRPSGRLLEDRRAWREALEDREKQWVRPHALTRHRVDTGVADCAIRRDRLLHLEFLVEATRADSEQHREHQYGRRFEQHREGHDMREADCSGESRRTGPGVWGSGGPRQKVDDRDRQQQNRDLTYDAILCEHGQKAVVYGHSGLLAIEREQALFLLHHGSLPDTDADHGRLP